MLLDLGRLTTALPELAPYTAPYWPILRYLHIFSNSPALELQAEWKDVDFHQKTVASDDLGVGVTISALKDRFHYTHWDDGASYARRLKALGFLKSPKFSDSPKRGPNKSPDYVFLTPAKKLHFVECKGTQTSREALIKALGTAVGQKNSIAFAKAKHEKDFVDQRLAAGLFVARQGMPKPSAILIGDPEPIDPSFISREISARVLEGVLQVGHLSKLLTCAGFVRTALAIDRNIFPTHSLNLERGREEISIEAAFTLDQQSLDTFEADGEKWIGRKITLPLPEGIQRPEARVRYLEVSYGLHKSILPPLQELFAKERFFLLDEFQETAARFRDQERKRSDEAAEILSPKAFIAELRSRTDLDRGLVG